MEKPKLEGLPADALRYIKYLEAQLFGTPKLIKELQLVSSGIADDLEMIRMGSDGEEGANLKYIKPDKNDALFKNIMVIMNNAEMFNKLSKMIQDEEGVDPKTGIKKEKKVANLQDFVLNK